MSLMRNALQRMRFFLILPLLLLACACDVPPSNGSGTDNTDAISIGKPDTFTTERMRVDWEKTGPNYVYTDDVLRFQLPPDLIGAVFTLNDPGNSAIVYESLFNNQLNTAAYTISGRPAPLSRGTNTWPDAVALGIPSNAKTVPSNGATLELDLASMGGRIGESADLYITSLRRSNLELGDHVDIQARVLNDAISVQELAQLDQALKDIYTHACRGLSHCLTPHILDDYIALTYDDGEFDGSLVVPDEPSPVNAPTIYDELSAYTMDDMERGINVVFVPELLMGSLDNDLSLLGISGGIPAPPFDGTRASSLFISVDAHRIGRTVNISFMAGTIAHELGHMMGLFHTTEQRGNEFDAIADTPECSSDVYSVDSSGRVKARACKAADGNNMMFWEADISTNACALNPADCATLSSEQVMVLRSHPLAYRDP